MTLASSTASPPVAGEARISGLDGIRGAMTLMVVISHYFGEVEAGFNAARVGWLAVVGFFALSGFLIGRLILERMHHANFVQVFYIRRFLRMLPPFFVVLAAIYLIYALVAHLHWADVDPMFPAWTYASFTQNFYMLQIGALGPHWLAPTWTLAVEEHFYLLAPAALMLTPRRHLLKALIAVGLASLALRIAIFEFALAPQIAGRVLIPAIADTLVAGMIAGLLWKTDGFPWPRWDMALRAGAPVMLGLAALAQMVDQQIGTHLFATFGTTFMAVGTACLLLAIMRGAPEAKRFESRVLCFFGHLSYCIYLTHLAVLGLMHGLILGTRPDIATAEQFAVTIAAFPVTVLVGWVLYKTVEEPCMHFARRFAWSKDKRAERGAFATA